jgi:hypothetical protein
LPADVPFGTARALMRSEDSVRRSIRIAALSLCVSWLSSTAQGPPALDTFTSPDGAFEFAYPESYALLVGESIVRWTQGRNSALPVCNFATAVACVIYPIEGLPETRMEAAGFSVDKIATAATEADCLTFADQVAQLRGAASLTSVTLHERKFRHTAATRKLPGHLQAAEFYRTFSQQKCYELQVAVSLADEPVSRRTSPPGSLGDPTADSARESLRLILSSTVFQKE